MISSDRIHQLGGWLFQVILAGSLGMLWLLETWARAGNAWPELGLILIAPTALTGVAAIAAVFFADRVLPAWGALLAAASAAATIVEFELKFVMPGVAEGCALLVAVVWCVRRWDAPWGKAASASLVVAAMMLPARASDGPQLAVLVVLVAFPVIAAVATGLYLRSADLRRKRALTEVRRGERLELARDLHDFVAHHVTGIVVQAQAAQYLSDDDARRSREAFAAIEQAGLEALTSMRRLVAVMREGEDGAGARPLGDLAQTAELVERFRLGDDFAVLYLSPELTPESLPPEVASSIYRVVQEGLTNVRKHASTASAVTVSISKASVNVEVAVRDNGMSNRHNRLSNVGGGYGLAGLAERVRALGGELTAGPRPEGGWETTARLPMAGSRSPQA
ncbi:MAG: sensor histidine kinase [Stackebrandtia sp.]